MTKIPTHKLYTLLIMFFSTLSVQSITFDVQTLKDAQQPNFIKFKDTKYNPPDSFEIIAADFNGDGIDDMLSMGGLVDNFGTGGVTPNFPLAMMARMMSL